jgi:hypothetical protein
VSAAVLSTVNLIDGHSIANTGAWLRPKEIEEVSIVIVAFDRQTREWPAGVAQHFCSQLFGEIGDDKAVLVATDGSFNGDWGYHICSNDTTITEDSGCHTVYTSSTRMEFEVIQCALGRLALLELNSNNTVIFGTDSMAVLTKIQPGNLPSGWSCFRDKISLCEVWMYVPGHAGVLTHGRDDTLKKSTSLMWMLLNHCMHSTGFLLFNPASNPHFTVFKYDECRHFLESNMAADTILD